MITTELIYEVVGNLTGSIMPIGETQTDNIRFENLKILTELINKLVTDIDEVGMLDKRQEYSVKRAGEFATNFLIKDLGIIE